MPRKRKETKLVKYFIPEGSKEIIDSIVEDGTYYKNKPVWRQKFYHLCDYIANQNFLNDIDPETEYVNIHQHTMAKILGVDNHQMATMLKECVSNKLFKKDGIFKTAVVSRNGRNREYIEEGKSYGYQFREWNNLLEIEIANNRCVHEQILNKTIELNTKYNPDLKEYQEVLSFIRIDESHLQDIIKEVLENKPKKKSQKENYEKFIKEVEDNFTNNSDVNLIIHYLSYDNYNTSSTNNSNNTNYCQYIPFGGVPVPIYNDIKIGRAYPYRNSLEEGISVPKEKISNLEEGMSVPEIVVTKVVDGMSVPCQPVKFKLHRYKKKKRLEKDVKHEDDETTIARCNRTVYKINNGYMVASRPIKGSRVYCDITNLNREFRKSILLDGKKIIGLDIRNSQPLLAAVMFISYYKDEIELPEDVKQYQGDCESGIFYNQFMETINLPDELRQEFKQDFFRKVFFSKDIERNNALKDLFMNKYPSCWKAIVDIKGGLYSKEYSDFAKMLQEVEAAIIFDNVNRELLNQRIKAFNIFDSIYVSSVYEYDIAKRLVLEAFNEYGIMPTLNIEYPEHIEEYYTDQKISYLATDQLIEDDLPEDLKQKRIEYDFDNSTDEEKRIFLVCEKMTLDERQRAKDQEDIRRFYANLSIEQKRKWGISGNY